MCLQIRTLCSTVEEAVNKYKQIATRNIVVYKVLNRVKWKNQHGEGIKYTGPYRSFPYKLGYHYYQTDVKFTYYLWKYCDEFNVYQGLHAYRGISYIPRYFKNKTKYVIIKCIVPKGSEYFFGNDGDIVTDNLILDSIYKNY